jgi:hypothetical protein
MLDVIITTLATGPKYVDLGVKLLRALDAAGNATLVVTDDPEAFPERTIKIAYERDGAHIWHAKRHAVRAGLELAQTAYFVDADYQPREGVAIEKLQSLPSGLASGWGVQALSAVRFRNVGSLVDVQILQHGHILDLIQAELRTPSWRDLLWWGDNLYAVSRDAEGAWATFLDAWDRFTTFQSAALCAVDVRRTFVCGDGIAMAFAAGVAGLQPVWNPAAFAPIRRAFAHVGAGDHYKRALEEAIRCPSV